MRKDLESEVMKSDAMMKSDTMKPGVMKSDVSKPEAAVAHGAPACMAAGLRECGSCRYWAEEASGVKGHSWGDCRRHPPGLHSELMPGQWPFTRDDHWCGEFAARLN